MGADFRRRNGYRANIEGISISYCSDVVPSWIDSLPLSVSGAYQHMEMEMLQFLASVLDQMDRALEHISKRGVHEARFGLMLTDNAVELVLHQIAQDQKVELRYLRMMGEQFPHMSELEEALGRSFDAKLKFAKIRGNVTDEVARTLGILHSFRNEVYHVGIQHEQILPDLAEMHFVTACDFIGAFEPKWWGGSRDMVIPDRAHQYFPVGLFMADRDGFSKACQTMKAQCGYDKKRLIGALADRMEGIVQDSDENLRIVAEGVYVHQTKSRDEAVRECQAWVLASKEEGTAFARDKGWQGSNFLQLVKWLAENYRFQERKDPIPSWTRQVTRLRSNGNPHKALANYQSFIQASAHLRDLLAEDARLAEEEIERASDAYRESRWDGPDD